MGTSNDDLCQKLHDNGVISDPEVLKAFRITDRGDFVQQNQRSVASSL
jgi:protein-L-isoaspartate O-methyltransferase